MRAKRGPVRHDDQQTAAEALAIAALTFIAGEPERLGRFLALTGIGPESIRAAAHEPRFLLGVLDHLVGEEPLLLAFAAENSIAPSAVMQARDTIAGRPWERDTPWGVVIAGATPATSERTIAGLLPRLPPRCTGASRPLLRLRLAA